MPSSQQTKSRSPSQQTLWTLLGVALCCLYHIHPVAQAGRSCDACPAWHTPVPRGRAVPQSPVTVSILPRRRLRLTTQPSRDGREQIIRFPSCSQVGGSCDHDTKEMSEC